MIGNAHIQWDVLCFKWYHHFLSRSVVKHVVIFLNSLFSKSHTIPHSEYCTALCLRHICGWSFAVALRNFARRAFLGYFSHSKKKKREQAIASSQEQNRLFCTFFVTFLVFDSWYPERRYRIGRSSPLTTFSSALVSTRYRGICMLSQTSPRCLCYPLKFEVWTPISAYYLLN